MKEIEQKAQEPTEQVAQAQQKKGTKFKYKVALKSGHSVWEVNLNTGEIKKAVYESSANINFKTKQSSKKLIENEDCIYIPALNKVNAKRKFDGIIARVKAKHTKK